MQVLEALVEQPRGLSVAEAALRVQVGKSIASRLLATLAESGYVQRDPFTERYSLSLKLVALAFRFSDAVQFPQVCLPVLQRLAEESGELVQLLVVEQERLVYVARAEGNQHVQVVSRLGKEVPLHATASGKVWLAHLPEERAVALALSSGLRPLTPRTITDIETLLQELRRAREQGYATIEGELAEGANGVAAPIGRARFGAVVGTVVMSAPGFRLPTERLHLVAPRLIEAAQELEAVWPLDAHRLPDASLVGPNGLKHGSHWGKG